MRRIHDRGVDSRVVSVSCKAREREAASYELQNTSLDVPGYQRYIRTHTSVRSVVYTLSMLFSYERTCVVLIVVRTLPV